MSVYLELSHICTDATSLRSAERYAVTHLLDYLPPAKDDLDNERADED